MRLLLLVLCLSIFAGCGNDDEIPKDVIAKDKMGKIFWDMIQADQYAIQYLTKDSARSKLMPETMKLYEEIFRIHHVSRQEFQKSFQFYQAHPALTKTIFDSLSVAATRQRVELFKSPPKTRKNPE